MRRWVFLFFLLFIVIHIVKAQHETPPIPEVEGFICLRVSSDTVELNETVVLYGVLDPNVTTTITLSYHTPNGTTFTKKVQVVFGNFSDSFVANQNGEWKITASWTGMLSPFGTRLRYHRYTETESKITVYAGTRPSNNWPIVAMITIAVISTAIIGWKITTKSKLTTHES